MSFDLHAIQEPLENWLVAQRSDVQSLRLSLEDYRQPEGSGYSATTLIIPLHCDYNNGKAGDEKIVLRMEPPEAAVYPQQAPELTVEIDIQFRAMQALQQHSSLPLAPLIGIEHDPSILGAAFYAMEFIEGIAPIENPCYVSEGFFKDAQAQQRRQLIERGIGIMAALHDVDWQAAGFGWLVPDKVTPGTLRQLNLWEAYARRELKGRELPALHRCFEWLHANLPQDTALNISWGDARPGNIMWKNFEPNCVTDFENISIAPAEQDVGWWLMFDRFSHEAQGHARLEGEPTRDEQLGLYEQASGRTLQNLAYHELFSAARYTAIVVRVMNRLVDRGDLPEDQTIWYDNPVAHMLTAMMSEAGI